MTQAQLARRLAVNRQAIHDLVKRGIIAAGDDGLIDVIAATDAIANTLRIDSKTAAAVHSETPAESPPGSQPAAPPTPETTSYHVARTLREIAEAKIANFKLQTMAGELVDAGKVKVAATTIAAMTRSALEKIPDKLAGRFASETDPAACHALLTAEIDSVLADLALSCRNLNTASHGRN